MFYWTKVVTEGLKGSKMKIYSYYLLDGHPESHRVVEWIPAEKVCDIYTYSQYTIPPNSDNWFRNVELIDETAPGRGHSYHIRFEKRHQYFFVEISNLDALVELLTLLGESAGLFCHDGKLWVDFVGDE
jgi:hypothetical protein